MCQSCSSGTQATIAITHAVPVDILSLGPSLAALEKLKPAIHQLQLCHRLGRGHNVSQYPAA